MKRFVALASVVVLLCGSVAMGAQPKALKVSVSAVSCGTMSTLFTEKGVCFVHDILEGKNYIEVAIAAGVNVSSGTLLIGGQVKSMLEVRMQFPLGTSKVDALAAAKQELGKQLLQKKVKDELRSREAEYQRAEAVRELIDCRTDKARMEAIDKLIKNLK